MPDSDPGALISGSTAPCARPKPCSPRRWRNRGCLSSPTVRSTICPPPRRSATSSHTGLRTLTPATSPIVGRLRAGQRTPLFLIGKGGAYPRYSWYQRLADLDGGHSWTGVVRAEVSSHLDLETARVVANRTAAVLPQVASEPHIDPTAPQNLVPIAALERELRRRLGDPGFVYRALRSAVSANPPCRSDLMTDDKRSNRRPGSAVSSVRSTPRPASSGGARRRRVPATRRPGRGADRGAQTG